MIVFGLIMLILSGWSAYSSAVTLITYPADFYENCIRYEETAIYAENIDDSIDGLTTAVSYLDKKGYNAGPNYDYYNLLNNQLEKLNSAKASSETDQKITLLEVRNNLGGDDFLGKTPIDRGMPLPFYVYILQFVVSLVFVIFSGIIIIASFD